MGPQLQETPVLLGRAARAPRGPGSHRAPASQGGKLRHLLGAVSIVHHRGGDGPAAGDGLRTTRIRRRLRKVQVRSREKGRSVRTHRIRGDAFSGNHFGDGVRQRFERVREGERRFPRLRAWPRFPRDV